jgi:hypothetical protein
MGISSERQPGLSGVTASASELNILDGVTKTAAEINNLAQKPGNVLTVGTSGCDYTTIAAAVTGAASASLTNRYLIEVYEGVTRWQGYIPPGVDIVYTADAVKPLYLLSGHQSGQKLRTMISDDGIRFGPVSDLVKYNTTVRDPSIVYWNGWFWAMYTIAGALTIGLCKSRNAVDWTAVATLTPLVEGQTVYHNYAPSLFVDSDNTIHAFWCITVADNTNTFQIYHSTPTAATVIDGTLSAWAKGTLLTGTAIPDNVIDPSCIKNGSTYRIWFKDDTSKHMGFMESATITGSYVVPAATQITAGRINHWIGDVQGEGPNEVILPDGTHRLYYWNQSTLINKYVDTADDWVTPGTHYAITMPYTTSNSKVLPVTDGAAIQTLLRTAVASAWGRGGVQGLAATDYSAAATPAFRYLGVDQPVQLIRCATGSGNYEVVISFDYIFESEAALGGSVKFIVDLAATNPQVKFQFRDTALTLPRAGSATRWYVEVMQVPVEAGAGLLANSGGDFIVTQCSQVSPMEA